MIFHKGGVREGNYNVILLQTFIYAKMKSFFLAFSFSDIARGAQCETEQNISPRDTK